MIVTTLVILKMPFRYIFFKHFLLICLFVFFNTQVTAQYQLKEIIAADKLNPFTEKKVDSILYAIKKKDSLFAEISHNFSFFFYKKKKEYLLAIKYGTIEVKILDSLKINNKTHPNALYNLGNFYLEKKQYNKAITNYKKAVTFNVFPLKVAQSYCKLGECYFRKGDFYKSIDYYLKGIPLMEKYSNKKGQLIQYIKFSYNCNKMDSKKGTELGLFYLKKADSIIKNTPNLKVATNILYPLNNSFANLYSLKHEYNFDKAKYYYKYNLKNALLDNSINTVSNTYLNIGELYLNKNNDSCIYFLKQSLKFDTLKKYDYHETYRNIAKYYKKKKLFKKALTSINSSLKYNFNVKNITEINSLSIEKLTNTKDKRSIVQALKTKTEILIQLYNTTNNQQFLNKAIQTVRFTSKLTTVLASYNAENKTRFLWREEVSKIFGLGINTAYLLKDSSVMFEFMEKNKAFLLTQDINNNRASLSLPEDVSQKNIAYKKLIFSLTSELLKNELTSKRDSLFNLKEKYQYFLTQTKIKFPKSNLNYNESIKTTTLLNTSKNLKKNELILYYSLCNTEINNKKTLFGLLVSNKNKFLFKIENTSEVLQLLSEYKNLISKPLTKQKELTRFKKNSYALFNFLFPTPEIKNIIKDKNLTIINDTYLENIPFEAFNTSKNELNYLVKECNISYAYSMSFSQFNKKLKRQNSKNLSLFAPIKFKNDTLISLKNSEEEAKTIQKQIDGEIYHKNLATKANFINKTSSSKIIHLATHASASKNPSIQFYDKELKLHELYTYKNSADLVVLSACETNIGEVKRGEGILNLARGFFYSGANTVISSLWNVNDKTTAYLMTNFYKNLKDGQTKSLALTNAKRAYLKKHSLSEKSPYYWATFVLIGDPDEINLTNYNYLHILLLGILLVSSLFFYLKNKKKRVT